jgi:hypothetical protein
MVTVFRVGDAVGEEGEVSGGDRSFNERSI